MSYTLSHNTNTPVIMNGNQIMKSGQTIKQDAARATALAFMTVMTYDSAASKWVPMATLGESAAVMVCGAAGTVAAFEAVTDGELGISVDGIAIELEGLDFSNATSLSEVADIITAAAAGKFTCEYNVADDKFRFISASKGFGSSVSVLVDPDEGGTDITGASYLNGLTGTGTAGTGSGGTPDGIYIGSGVTAAALVAGDVTGNPIVVAGNALVYDKNQVVFEGGITLTSILPSSSQTVEQEFAKLGIFFGDSEVVSGQQA